MSLSQIRRWLEAHGLAPQKRLGQHFLFDQNLAESIVRIALEGFSTLSGAVEIGPGLGALTEPLLARGLTVVAIEIDPGLCRILRERFASLPRFHLIEGDALRVELPTCHQFPLLLGNLPYNVATPLVLHWIAHRYSPRRLALTLQREVAQRFVAAPSTPAYGAVSVLLQSEYRVKLAKRMPPSVFFPRPGVESALVLLDRREEAPFSPGERLEFYRLVRSAFAHRRKMLSTTLRIPDSRRPEELSPQEWIALWKSLPKEKSFHPGG